MVDELDEMWKVRFGSHFGYSPGIHCKCCLCSQTAQFEVQNTVLKKMMWAYMEVLV